MVKSAGEDANLVVVLNWVDEWRKGGRQPRAAR